MNALKHSGDNSIFDISLEKSESNSEKVVFKNEIREGINQDISTVKKSFYHSKPFQGKGSGLGLWIANQLTELNGFELNVKIVGNIFEMVLKT